MSSLSSGEDSQLFVIKDCALLAIATGEKAYALSELADVIMSIHPGSLYYHFWGGLLRPRFDDPEYRNDFAAWASHELHDEILAERLGIIVPAEYENLERLREELLELIEQRLDEIEFAHLVRAVQPFQFIRSQIVVFDTGRRIDRPAKLRAIIPKLSLSSLFYHFIDARRRLPDSVDDFTAWLSPQGEMYHELLESLAKVDPYLNSLSELRKILTDIFDEHLKGGTG